MTFSEPWLFWGASWPFPRGFTTCVFPKHVDYNILFAEEHCRKGTFSRGTGLRGRNSRSIAPLGFTISPKGTSLSAISRVWRHWELERGGHPSSVRLLLMPTSTAVRARYISSGATAVSWRSTHLPVQVQDLHRLAYSQPSIRLLLKTLKTRESCMCPDINSLLPTSGDGRDISLPLGQMQPRRVGSHPEKSDTQAEFLPKIKHSWAPISHLSWQIFSFPSSLLSAPLAPRMLSDSLVLWQFLCKDYKGMQAWQPQAAHTAKNRLLSALDTSKCHFRNPQLILFPF